MALWLSHVWGGRARQAHGAAQLEDAEIDDLRNPAGSAEERRRTWHFPGWRGFTAASVATGGAAALQVLRTKLLSEWIGPDGLGVTVMVMSTVSVLAFTSTLGLGPVTGHQAARFFARGEGSAVREVLLSRLALVLLASVALGMLAFAGSAAVVEFPIALAIGVSPPGVAVTLFVTPSILAASRPRSTMAALLLPATLQAGTAVALVPIAGVNGALAAFWVAALLAAGIALPMALSGARGSPERESPGAVHASDEQTKRVALTTLLSSLVSSISAVGIRSAVLLSVDPTAVGNFHAAAGLSAMSASLVITAVGARSIPTIAASGSNQHVLEAELRRAMTQSLILYLPWLFVSLIMSGFVVTAFYSSEFTGAKDLLPVTIAADLCFLAQWAATAHFLPERRLRALLTVEVVRYGSILALSLVLSAAAGVEGAAIAYAVGSALGMVAAILHSPESRSKSWWPIWTLIFIGLVLGLLRGGSSFVLNPVEGG